MVCRNKGPFLGSLSWIFEYNSIQDGETNFDAEFSDPNVLTIINSTYHDPTKENPKRSWQNVSETWSDKIVRFNDAMKVSEI